MMFDKVRCDMRGRSNQFQVATKLISYFRMEGDWHAYSLEEADRRLASLEAMARYFGLPYYLFTNGLDDGLRWYIAGASPAALVQIVKRIKSRYKTQES